MPSLTGQYVYADWVTSNWWSFDPSEKSPTRSWPIRSPSLCQVARSTTSGRASASAVTVRGAEEPWVWRRGSSIVARRICSALATLAHVGLLAAPVVPEPDSILPLTDGYDTEERRSRGYLHANCAFCHDGTGTSKLDLRFTSRRPDAQGGVCSLVTAMRAKDVGRTAIQLLESWVGSLHVCP